MKYYDAIIVGAGPGGLKCSEELSKSNLKVLLLEQNNIIGPKICAGGIQNKDLEYIDLPEELLERKFKVLHFNTPLNRTLIKNDDHFLFTISREKLGQWQLNKLKNTNVVIKTNSKVTGIEKEKIIVNDNEAYKYKYLIGADGSNSMVRRHLNLTAKNKAYAFQYIIPTKTQNNFEIFFNSKLFHSGYIWIFPHKNYVSIGAGYNSKTFSAKKTRNNFNQWLKEKDIDVSNGQLQAYPINYDYQGYKFNNIFLIGDAAGLASGLTGAGIYPALVSGKEIAKMIIDDKYISKKMSELLKFKKFHDRILNILTNSGVFRGILFELMAILLKNKRFCKKFINDLI